MALPNKTTHYAALPERIPPNTLIYPQENYQLVGACFQVYNELGCGFLEAVYQEALALELTDQGLPYLAKPTLQIQYKRATLESTYHPDFICFEKIILEIKAVKALSPQHQAQVHNYLKATGYRLGILVNFGEHPKVVYERIVR